MLNKMLNSSLTYAFNTVLVCIFTASVYPFFAKADDADFQARCAAPGVLVCEGFDEASTFNPVISGDGLYASDQGKGTLRGFQDQSIRASGASSLRFEIPGQTGSDGAGSFRKSFGQSFGEQSTFYVQFQQRFSQEMLSNDWGDTYWKQVIIHGKEGGSCQAVQLVTNNPYNRGLPAMYSACGARNLHTTLDRSSWTSNTPLLLQQGTSDTDGYNCQYGSGYPSGSGNGSGCFKYPAERWVTFYYQVQVGAWGQANSKVKAWVSVDGKPYKQWISVPNMIIDNPYEDRDNDFSRLMLTPYMTNKNSSLDHPTARTWYDELIVSTQPIASPGTLNPLVLDPPPNLRFID